MPTFLVHAQYLLLFILAFSIGTFVWDIDHLFKCNNRLLFKAMLSTNGINEGYRELQQLNQNDCRGYFHTINFAIILVAITLAYMLHMCLDKVGWL